MDNLSPAQAAELAGAPVAQLLRWAWDDWDRYSKKPYGKIGPRNVGTRHKPMFREADVIAWRKEKEKFGPLYVGNWNGRGVTDTF